MALQDDRACAMFLHLWETDPLCRTQYRRMVLQNHAVLDNRYGWMRAIRTIFLESGGGINDIVHVPFARFTHGVGQRNGLFVDTTRLAVHVSRVIVAV